MTAQLAMDLCAGELGEQAAARHLGDRECDVITRWARDVADQAGEDGFTSDDVRRTLPVWIEAKLRKAPNAMGAIFKGLAKSGEIERTNLEPRVALHPGARGRKQPVWRKVVRP